MKEDSRAFTGLKELIESKKESDHLIPWTKIQKLDGQSIYWTSYGINLFKIEYVVNNDYSKCKSWLSMTFDKWLLRDYLCPKRVVLFHKNPGSDIIDLNDKHVDLKDKPMFQIEYPGFSGDSKILLEDFLKQGPEVFEMMGTLPENAQQILNELIDKMRQYKDDPLSQYCT